MTTDGMWQCLSGMQCIKKDRSFRIFKQLFYFGIICHYLFESSNLVLEQLQSS